MPGFPGRTEMNLRGTDLRYIISVCAGPPWCAVTYRLLQTSPTHRARQNTQPLGPWSSWLRALCLLLILSQEGCLTDGHTRWHHLSRRVSCLDISRSIEGGAAGSQWVRTEFQFCKMKQTVGRGGRQAVHNGEDTDTTELSTLKWPKQ